MEGYALGTPLQFRRHLRIALGSAAEAEAFVRTAREVEYLDPDTAQRLEHLLDGVLRTLFGLVRRPVKPTV